MLKQLGVLEGRPDYLDRAIIEFTAAIHHQELAGHERFRATNENNLANLLRKLRHYRQAHEHLDRAGARGNVEGSINALRRAVKVAEDAGARSHAGPAMLTLMEEHGMRRALPQKELYELYQRADSLLKDVQHPETVGRLRACARIVMRRLAGVRPDDKNFTFFSAAQESEEKLIEWALDEAQGSVVKAARLLGLKHQTFSSMLDQRHEKFLEKRTPRVKRLRSIIKESKE